MGNRYIADGPDLEGLRFCYDRDRPVIFAMADGSHVEVRIEPGQLLQLEDDSVVLYGSDSSGRRLKIEYCHTRLYGAKGFEIIGGG